MPGDRHIFVQVRDRGRDFEGCARFFACDLRARA